MASITEKFNKLERYKNMRVKKIWLDGKYEDLAGWRWENHYQAFGGKTFCLIVQIIIYGLYEGDLIRIKCSQ